VNLVAQLSAGAIESDVGYAFGWSAFACAVLAVTKAEGVTDNASVRLFHLQSEMWRARPSQPTQRARRDKNHTIEDLMDNEVCRYEIICKLLNRGLDRNQSYFKH